MQHEDHRCAFGQTVACKSGIDKVGSELSVRSHSVLQTMFLSGEMIYLDAASAENIGVWQKTLHFDMMETRYFVAWSSSETLCLITVPKVK
jgi:hypothetical protein